MKEGEKTVSNQLERALNGITKCQKTHGQWLNTLSFMEYIGARKILKALPASVLNETLLGHISEEAFHSLFFKKLARKVTGGDPRFKEEDMLAEEECEGYFQNIDKKSKEISKGDVLLNYLYTTWAVETRAVCVYSIYNRILKDGGFFFSLNSVLKDETGHLKQVENSIGERDENHKLHFQELMKFECREFSSLLCALEREVKRAPLS